MSGPSKDGTCPKCGGEIDQGYGLAGGGIGVYEYCTVDGCDHFYKWPDPELSTPEEMAAHAKAEAEAQQ